MELAPIPGNDGVTVCSCAGSESQLPPQLKGGSSPTHLISVAPFGFLARIQRRFGFPYARRRRIIESARSFPRLTCLARIATDRDDANVLLPPTCTNILLCQCLVRRPEHSIAQLTQVARPISAASPRPACFCKVRVSARSSALGDPTPRSPEACTAASPAADESPLSRGEEAEAAAGGASEACCWSSWGACIARHSRVVKSQARRRPDLAQLRSRAESVSENKGSLRREASAEGRYERARASCQTLSSAESIVTIQAFKEVMLAETAQTELFIFGSHDDLFRNRESDDI